MVLTKDQQDKAFGDTIKDIQKRGPATFTKQEYRDIITKAEARVADLITSLRTGLNAKENTLTDANVEDLIMTIIKARQSTS
jgi:hypothetical protein